MGTRSTIMDTNSFRPEHAAELDHATRKLTDKRNKILGESYRLFYRNPVHLVKGQGNIYGMQQVINIWMFTTMLPALVIVILRSLKR